MFIIGLAGFAVASAVGGASVNFAMLVTARACQGVFGAMLAPAALSLLATTFTDPKERGKAFGIYGSVAAGGGAVGLLLGGALTSYLSWRWCLYINLVFAGAAIIGALALLHGRPGRAAGAAGRPRRGRGLRRRVLPGLRVLQRRDAQLVDAVDVPLPARRRGAARRVRVLDVPRQVPAAAAPGGARPQPGRRLPRHPDRRRGHVRHLPVRHLLPAGHPALLAGHHRAWRSCRWSRASP